MNPLDSFRLDGKVALVTGATGALCQAMCHALAAAGARLVLVARKEDRLNALARAVREQGGAAYPISADVLEIPDMRGVARRTMQQFGRLDILVNGAGGNRPDATTIPGQRSFFDLPPETLRWVFDLNLMGAILPSQILGPLMVQQRSGVIINLASMAAYQPLTRVVAYASAKAAVVNFTQWLAVYMATEHSPDIRVNAIAPGFFLGDQNRYLLMDEATGDLTPRGQAIINHTPMARFGSPDDLIGTLLWLASDASRFVTGVVVPVDGGFMASGGV